VNKPGNSNRFSVILSVFLWCSAAATACGALVLYTRIPSVGVPDLEIASDELSFGEAFDGQSLDHCFHITNNTTGPITIGGFKFSCSCLKVEPATNVALQPGESTLFTATLGISLRKWPTALDNKEEIDVGFTVFYLIKRRKRNTRSINPRFGASNLALCRFRSRANFKPLAAGG
jgi:hypothetical protein